MIDMASSPQSVASSPPPMGSDALAVSDVRGTLRNQGKEV